MHSSKVHQVESLPLWQCQHVHAGQVLNKHNAGGLEELQVENKSWNCADSSSQSNTDVALV